MQTTTNKIKDYGPDNVPGNIISTHTILANSHNSPACVDIIFILQKKKSEI